MALLLVAGMPVHPLWAADDQAVAKAREMLRRTQEALRQAQSDNAALTQAKTELEAKLGGMTRELEASRTGLSAARGSLRSMQGLQADLQGRYQEANGRLAATTEQLNEATRKLAARDAELAQALQRLTASEQSNVACEDKNGMLYAYGQEILARYQHKGVWAALKQQEPVLGLNRVEVENVVQEYRLKMADAKLKEGGH
ncbi:MAG TPA: hypothetical protein VMT83_11385 [Burkholderiaceae bacterium]|nr:hypothetical protein [Burkholderiaceae bacterium]